jgi:hypothetical protein
MNEPSPNTVLDLAALIRAWCAEQLAPWLARRQPRRAAAAAFEHLNASDPSTFVLVIERGEVGIAAKPASAGPALYPAAHERAARYRAFLQSVVSAYTPELTTMLALSVGPTPPQAPSLPVFACHKPRGNPCVLLPDASLIGAPATEPAPPYLDRSLSAVFVGATEGGLITEDVARRHALPRLRVAARFAGHPAVQILLPDLVGCDSEATKVLLRAQGLGDGAAVSWAEQLHHRFLIAIDGNDADAARIAAALRSGGVLLAYASAHALYYQSGLTPWLHYVPIAQDEDVETVLRIEQIHNGFFAPVAAAGERFAALALSADAVRAYTASLLRAYAAACFTDDVAVPEAPAPAPEPAAPPAPVAEPTVPPAPEPAAAPAPSLDILVHVSGIGDVRGSTTDWAGRRGTGKAIEGLQLLPGSGFTAEDFAVQVVLHDKALSDWVAADTYCGTRGRSQVLRGFAIRLAGAAAASHVLYYSATFVDGSEVGPLPSGEVCRAPSGAALEALRLLLLPVQ